MSAAPIVGS